MAKVHTLDINGEQWEMQDLSLTARVQALEDGMILSSYEDFSISHSSANPTEAPYDGVLHLIGNVGANNPDYLYINGQAIIFDNFFNASGVTYNFSSGDIHVSKGDKLYIPSGTGVTQSKAAWYKQRDYSNR